MPAKRDYRYNHFKSISDRSWLKAEILASAFTGAKNSRGMTLYEQTIVDYIVKYDKDVVEVKKHYNVVLSNNIEHSRLKHEIDIVCVYDDRTLMYNSKSACISHTEDPIHHAMMMKECEALVSNLMNKPTTYSILRVGGGVIPAYEKVGIRTIDTDQFLTSLSGTKTSITLLVENEFHKTVIKKINDIAKMLDEPSLAQEIIKANNLVQ